MKTLYKVRSHQARKRGATGAFYQITKKIAAASEGEAEALFRDEYEINALPVVVKATRKRK